MKYEYICTLGGCCESTGVINTANSVHNIKNGYDSPFAWLSIHDFENVITMFETNFENFEITSVKEVPHVGFIQPCIVNTMMFLSHYNSDQWIDIAKRRSTRLMEYIKEGCYRILFIWKSHLDTRVTQDQADRFINIIKTLNPNLDFTFLIVNEFLNDEEQFDIIDKHVVYKKVTSDLAHVNFNRSGVVPVAINGCDMKSSPWWTDTFNEIL